jgi:GH24 family phage-related lysozyme (muramidase)
MARKFAAGDFAGGCAELMRWTFVTDHGVRKDCKAPENRNLCGGIVTRRQVERDICEGAIG